MNLDRLHTIVAELEQMMGNPCLRADLEAIATEFDRRPVEQLSQGSLWESALGEIEDNLLYIPNEEMLPPTITGQIISQMLRQDYPAWRSHLMSKNERERGEYDYGDGNFN